MKNKTGFTLIELLAVIVVLAIIALIATPIVMNTIKNAKKGAAERTADNYIKQVETAVAEAKLENKSVPNGTYDIDGNGNLTGAALPDGKLEIDMSGNKPTSGKVTIKNGGVSQDGTKLVVGDYNVKYKNDKLTASEPYKGVLCKANTTKATALVWNGKDYPLQESSYTREEVGLLATAGHEYDVGVTYTCELGDSDDSKNLTFYVLETSGDNVSLIAGKNLEAKVAWVSKEDYLAAGGTESDYGSQGNNSLGPITANKILKEKTSAWTKLDEDQVTMPTYNQIYIAAGNKSSKFPTWLYSYTEAPISQGYWTSTIDESKIYGAWLVSGYNFYSQYVELNLAYGVRPVITISKSNLS